MQPDDGTIADILAALARAWFVALVVSLGIAGAAPFLPFSSVNWGGQSWGEMLADLAAWGAI